MVKYHHHWILVNFTSKMKQPSQYTADGAGSHCKRRRNCHSHKNQLKTTATCDTQNFSQVAG